MTNERSPVKSLGILSVRGDLRSSRDELRASIDTLAPSDRHELADYLSQGAIVFAVMEYTRDVVEDAFGVPGGSAILTDGEYYWRRDAADYVRVHGIAPPAGFVEHARRRAWRVTPLTPDEILEIDSYLMANANASHDGPSVASRIARRGLPRERPEDLPSTDVSEP